ncbi:MAG: hypothetical protein FJ296_11285 [Planctomycetes bacterium]|nr:hypothetical protein [Planctomycetota bacterium]
MTSWLESLLSSAPQLAALGLALWAVAALTFTVVVAAWIARDAVARDLPAPWAFCLAAAFQPLVVLPVYVFARGALGARAAAERPRTT